MPDIPKLPEPGVGLCLSGGGYRAMLFHVGALWRMNELGLLPRLDRVSSVSGGSITAGWLALKWSSLGWDAEASVAKNFETEFVTGIRKLASRTVDIPSIVKGVLSPFSTVGEQVAQAYDETLFGGSTLQELPDKPRFVINASNLQSGVLWRFSKPYMRDYKVGNYPRPKLRLALAVAASSAFPPFLSPVQLRLKATDCEPDSGDGLQCEPFTTYPELADGGVYDNLGLESVFKRLNTVLVSDGGAAFRATSRPWRFWPLQLLRVIGCIDNQVRALRKRELIEHYQLRQVLLKHGYSENDWIVRASTHLGTYWGIATNPAEYPAHDSLGCTSAKIQPLASISTRLKALSDETQEKLINWGYAISDLALRSYYVPENSSPSPRFPYVRGLG